MKPEDYLAERYSEALAEVPCLEGEPLLESRMREMIYLNMTRFLPVLLDRVDRMSMASGLEAAKLMLWRICNIKWIARLPVIVYGLVG
jgi:asparagine synthetase B (glutamine-hydrolysing)